ncbi:hypothetical protein [Mesorhizobium sp. INR15]|uniref:hypothetical protein n=1 Tax=Mesorhizobium sp. INR15 TaxID=2654248 RepID=UPI0018969DA2|nr:hypothetical protein [Mesorhizobium sp. INR15]QPC89966.1 hypothetical protein GA829_04830 [Mesorhizobium sp. INR15]
MERQAGRQRLYQKAVCPQFDALSASSGGWGQIRGGPILAWHCPQDGVCPGNRNALTPVTDSELSPTSYILEKDARDNMLAGFFGGKTGQVTTTTTNRLLESEES